MNAATRQGISFLHVGETVGDIKLTLRAIPYIQDVFRYYS
jgi:hypothetical protein